MNKLLLLLILVSNVGLAKNVQGGGTIKNVYFHSKDSVIAAPWKGALQLEVNSLKWNVETNCNTNYVAIRGEDTHIVSAVLAARMSNRPIVVYVNDDLKITGSYCYVRAVGI